MSDSTKQTPEERLAADPQYPEVHARFTELLAADGLKVADAARESGIPGSTLSAWAADTIQGVRKNTTDRVVRYLSTKAAMKNPAIGMKRAPGFQETPTAAAIWARLVYAQTNGKMVVVQGPPAVGKTSAVTAYRDANSAAFLVTLRASTERLAAVVARILKQIGQPPANGATAGSDAILEFFGPKRGLLIIDEAHFADMQALEEIRSWSDEIKLGIALVGDKTLLAKLGKKGALGRAQLSSRIRQALSIEEPAREDIRAILDGWGLTDRLARNAAAAIAQGQDGLRGLEEVLELSFALAVLDGGTQPTAEHIDAANKSRGAGGAA